MKRFLQCILVVSLVLSISGCTKYSTTTEVYDTGVEGIYEDIIYYHEESHKQQELDLRNGQFVYTNWHGDNQYSSNGRFSTKEINNEIVELSFENSKYIEPTMYKYKNLIGFFIPVELNFSSTFTIPHWRGDTLYTFGKNGWATPNMDENKKFKYSIKHNIIYAFIERFDEYVPMCYIVDDGVFYPSGLTKAN